MLASRCLVAFASTLSLSALAACDAGGKNADVSTPGPQLHISSPRMDQTFPDAAKAEVLFDLREYEIGKVDDGKNGQHVHLIVDNLPYEAIYDVGKPIPLRDSSKAALAPGTHVIRAFPSAGPKDKRGMLHHESWKNPEAFAWVRFNVVKAGGDLEGFDANKPTLTYSRPKGDYKVGSPELDRFMIDYWLTGTRLATHGNAVRATLDGKQVGDPKTGQPIVFTAWHSETIKSPVVGEHEMLLELIDRDGKVVEGPFNATTRKFRVVEK